MLLHTLRVHHTPFQRNVKHVMLYTLRVNVKNKPRTHRNVLQYIRGQHILLHQVYVMVVTLCVSMLLRVSRTYAGKV